MELTDLVNQYLEKPKHKTDIRARLSHYPSEASCEGDGKIYGACLRALYWGWTGEKITNPNDAHSIRRMEIGKVIEELEVARYKTMGICAGKSVRFYLPEYNISGEVDAFVYDFFLDKDGFPAIITPRRIIGVEIKSAYGYKFQKGVDSVMKDEHLLQIMIYLLAYGGMFKWIYLALDNPSFKAEYNVILSNQGHSVINGKLETKFSIAGILERWRLLEQYLVEKTLPPRDYQWNCSKEEVEKRYKKGDITKRSFDDYENGKKLISDWNCLYCSWKNLCWKDELSKLKEEVEDGRITSD